MGDTLEDDNVYDIEGYIESLVECIKSKEFYLNLEKPEEQERAEQRPVPSFWCQSTEKSKYRKAKYLAVLTDPDARDVFQSRQVKPSNMDTAAKKISSILKCAKIEKTDVVYWNFYAAHGSFKSYKNERDYKTKVQIQKFWADMISVLVDKLPKVKVVVVCGDAAWLGMRFFKPNSDIYMIYSPHPANRRGKDGKDVAVCAWKAAKKLANKNKA